MYRIQPDGVLKMFWTYCDMTSFGGGWTMCYSTNNVVKPKVEVTYDQMLPYGTNGYRADCNNIPVNMLSLRRSIIILRRKKAGGCTFNHSTMWIFTQSIKNKNSHIFAIFITIHTRLCMLDLKVIERFGVNSLRALLKILFAKNYGFLSTSRQLFSH